MLPPALITKGALDDIGIWDRELSTTEINALFTSITDVKETSTSKELIAYPNLLKCCEF